MTATVTVRKPEKCLVVIFGATGDLTRRKLIPSIFDLYRNRRLPDNFAILGIGRRPHSDDSFRDMMSEAVIDFLGEKDIDRNRLSEFLKILHYHGMDQTVAESYGDFKKRLLELDQQYGTGGNFIYYLATLPSQFEVIADNLARQELHRESKERGWKRIIIEKPFGYDLRSARELNRNLQARFKEDQIYRIDHYLGKETVQNILAFRFANGIFEPLWNRNYIQHIEITAAEKIGVEDRGGYYEGAGALRDMVQNHLLQVMATIAMEPPSRFESTAVRNEKAKVFNSICPILSENVDKQVIRGQYTASSIKGENIPGYRSENRVESDSKTETFVAVKFFIDNWRWGGVPFLIRTGKRLPTHVTEVVIHFKKTPHYLFTGGTSTNAPENLLILRIQPDEGILLRYGMKLPGAGFQIKAVDMDFHYSELSDTRLPDAYERLLLDCMLGDATLYARADAVEACWDFLTPILDTWRNRPDIKLYGYPAGTWGPNEAGSLFSEVGGDWHYPCKNLAHDGEYCEL